jgi:hypothetical protein
MTIRRIEMKMKNVSSMTIESVGHNPDTNTLRVRFRNGVEYDYANVNAEQHAAFIGAESVGSHFHSNIKGKFEHIRIGSK